MAESKQLTRPRVRKASRFIGRVGWIVALAGLAAAILMGSPAAALLVTLFAGSWLAVSLLLDRFSRRRPAYLETHLSVRMTRWGLIFLLITVGFTVWAVQWGINLFCLTASFLLGAVLCSGVLAFLVLRRLEVDWTVPEHIYAGEVFPAVIRIRNTRATLSAFALELHNHHGHGSNGDGGQRIVRLPAGEERSRTLRQSLPQRGRHSLPPLRVTSGFPLGLMDSTLVAVNRDEVLVLPRLGRIHREAFLRRTGGEAKWRAVLQRKEPQGETRSLREYRPGDDPRHIHWPTTARMGKLHVREFEKRQGQCVLLLLDASLPGATAEEQLARKEDFERAVSFTATLGRLLVERSIFFAFVSYCPDLVSLPYQSSRPHMYDLMEALAVSQMTTMHGVGELFKAVDPRGVRGGICLVTPGPYVGGVPRQFESATTIVDVSEPDFDAIFSCPD